MSRMQRDKGARGEREVCHVWRGFGFDPHRTQSSGAFAHAPGDIGGIPGLHQEVKWCETWRMPSWQQQALRDCPEFNVPIIVYRASRTPWWMSMPLDEFCPLWSLKVMG